MKKTTLILAVLTSVILSACCSQDASAPGLRPMPIFKEEPRAIQEILVSDGNK